MASMTNARIRTTAGAVAAVAAILASLGFAVPSAASAATGASGVTEPAGFTAAIFASSTTLTKPDDITRLDGNLFVAFQNGVGSQGEPAPSGRTTSTVVEYSREGREVAHWDLTGKIDGLGADPRTHRVIATVNEDGNSSITTIEPECGEAEITHYAYSPAPLPHGGGTDSVTVRGGVVYLAASAPATDAHGSTAGKPAMYRVKFSGRTAKLTSVFTDDVTATDLVTGAKAPLNLTDPDSSGAVPRTVPGVGGSLMLVGQADKQLVFVRHPGTREQSASVLPLGAEVDDTAFTTATRGALYVVDNATGRIVAITGNFKRGQAFASAAALSTIDLSSGAVTPFGSGIETPKGLLFVPEETGDEGRHDDSGREG